MGAELTTCLFLSATATPTAAGEDTKQTPPDMIRIRFEDASGCNAAIESAGVADLRDWPIAHGLSQGFGPEARLAAAAHAYAYASLTTSFR